jgi:hypothetical protein
MINRSIKQFEGCKMLTDKLFAHINNDAHLTGMRTLEGETFANTIGYLKQYIAKNKNKNKELKWLDDKLDKMIEINDGTLDVINQLKENKNYEQGLRSLVWNISNDISKLPEGDSLFLAGGWNGKETGHAMVYEVKKDKNGGLAFIIYNTGSGINYHSEIESTDKKRYSSVKTYKIPFQYIENIRFFINELLKPRITPLGEESHLEENQYEAKRLYTEVFPIIYALGGAEVAPTEIDPTLAEVTTVGQRSGTCAESVLHELIKRAFKNKVQAKKFMLFFKMDSISQYYAGCEKPLEKKKSDQINLALDNLARIVLKQIENLSEDEVNQAYYFINETRKEMGHIYDLERIEKINYNNIQKGLEGNSLLVTNLSPCLDVKQDEYIIRKGSYFETLPIGGLDSLRNYKEEIDKLSRSGESVEVIRNIELLFLSLPLEEGFYRGHASIDILVAMSDLMDTYQDNLEKLGAAHRSPTQRIAMASGMFIAELLAQMNDIPIQLDLSGLKKDRPLRTGSIYLDERLRKISGARKYTQANENLAYYKQIISNCPDEIKVQETLSKIYDEKIKDLNILSKDEQTFIVNKSLKAEVALALFVDQSDLREAASENPVLKIVWAKADMKLKCESLIGKFQNALGRIQKNTHKRISPERQYYTISGINYDVDYDDTLINEHKFNDYFATVQNKEIKALNDIDCQEFGHIPNQNTIYTSHNVPGLDDEAMESEYSNKVNKMMWSLRIEPDVQVMRTLDFFSQNINLLANKNYQAYLKTNLFQPGLILNGIKQNNKFQSQLDTFISSSFKFYMRDNANLPAAIYFLDLANGALNYKQPASEDALHSLMDNVKEIQNRGIALPVEDEIILLGTALEVQVKLFAGNYVQKNEATIRSFISTYSKYCKLIEGQQNNTPEFCDKLNLIKRLATEFLHTNQAVLDEIVAAGPKELIGNEKVMASIKNWKLEFPNVVGMDGSNKEVVAYDIQSGSLWEGGSKIMTVPYELSSSSIYKSLIETSTLDSTVSILAGGANLTVEKTNLSYKNEDYNFYKTVQSKQAYICQKEHHIDGSKAWYELQILSDFNDPGHTTSLHGEKESKLELPTSFFCDTTRFWKKLDSEAAVIERSGRKYYLNNAYELNELDSEEKQTGYRLIKLNEMPELVDLFSSFEGPEFIEVYTNGSDVKIFFPRYGLELKAIQGEDKQWNIHILDQPNLKLVPAPQSNLKHFNGMLTFFDEKTQQSSFIMPVQEFYAEEASSKEVRADDEFYYHKLIFNTQNKIKDGKKVEPGDLKTSHYVDSERYLSIPVVPTGGDSCLIKPQNSTDALYLVYVALCQHEPRVALQYARDLTKSGGISGTDEELKMIERIMNAVPRYPDNAKIVNPEYTAVRAHLFSLIDAHDEKKYNILNQYHHVYKHIPSDMRLDLDQEYKALKALFRNKGTKPPSGPLGARYRKLQKMYFQKQGNEEKLSKPKNIKLQTSKLTTGDIKLREKLENTSYYYKYPDKRGNAKMPFLGISDDQYRDNFASYCHIAAEDDSEQKSALRTFSINAIKASHFSEKLQGTVIPTHSELLLKIMENPKQFRFGINKDGINIKHLFEEANKFSSTVTIAIPDNSIVPSDIEDVWLDSTPMHTGELIGFENIFMYERFSLDVYIEESGFGELNLAVNKAQLALEEEIKLYVEENYPKVGNYETRSNKIKEIDEWVGAKRNTWNETIESIATEFLPKLDLKYVHDRTKIYLNNSQKELNDLESEILKLANQGPEGLRDKLVFNLELEGKARGKIDFSDLNRLYILGDFNEYHRVTGLPDHEIRALHALLVNYMGLSILKQSYERKAKLIEKHMNGQGGNLVLVAGLTEANKADVVHDREMQFFQKEEKILAYALQKNYIDKLLNSKNEVVQLIMGGGKSKVISPIVSAKKADGKTLVIHQVKSGLFNTNYADARSVSMRLFNQEAIPFLYSRTSDSTSDDFKMLYDNFHKAMVNRNYIVTTGDSLQSLELKYVELLMTLPDENNKKEWCRQIKWLEKTLILIKEKGDRLIDEVHDELRTDKLLNYTLGASDAPPKQDIELLTNLFYFIESCEPNIIKEGKRIQDKIVWDNKFKDLVDKLVSDARSPIADIVGRMSLSAAEQVDLQLYLLDKSDALLSKIKDLPIDDKNALALIKLEITSVLPLTLKRNLYEHYGPSQKTDVCSIQKMLPIPYKANNTPSEESRFGNVIGNINYALQMALQVDLPDDLINEIIEKFLVQASSEILQSPEIDYKQTLASSKFIEITKLEEDILKKLKLGNQSYHSEIQCKLKESSEFKKYCLIEHILPKIQRNPKVLSSDAQNLVSMTKKKQGMTGTPWNVLAYHHDLNFDTKAGIGTDGQTVDHIRRKNTDVGTSIVFKSSKQFLDNTCVELNDLQRKNLRCIIDVGSLFTGHANISIAQGISEYVQENNKNIKYVLFYDNQTNALKALNVLDGSVKELGTSEEDKISSMLNCSPDERFTYYDQARAVGTDIVQAPTAFALCTVSENTTKDKLLQAVMRMRQYPKQQTVKLIVPEYLKPAAAGRALDLDFILELTHENQIKETLKSHFDGTIQKYRNIIRDDLLTRIYSIKDTSEKSKCMENFRAYFINESDVDHFAISGAISSEKSSAEYFQSLHGTHYSNWLRLLRDVGIDITEETSEGMKKKLESITVQGKNACKDTFRLSTSSSEVDSEVQNELENETEVETDQLTLHYGKKENPNNAHPFRLNDFPSKTLSANSVLNTFSNSVDFSPNLYFTNRFRSTIENQGEFFSIYTKPIEVVMMMQEEESPYTLSAIIMNSEEIKNIDIQRDNQQIWFTSPQGTILAGEGPAVITDEHRNLLEQIKYLNGNIKELASQKEPLTWLTKDYNKKIAFFNDHFLKFHADEAPFIDTLSSRIGVMTQIMDEIVHSEDLKVDMHWEEKYPNFLLLNHQKRETIHSLTKYIMRLNATFQNGDYSVLKEDVKFESVMADVRDDLKSMVAGRRAELCDKIEVLEAIERNDIKLLGSLANEMSDEERNIWNNNEHFFIMTKKSDQLEFLAHRIQQGSVEGVDVSLLNEDDVKSYILDNNQDLLTFAILSKKTLFVDFLMEKYSFDPLARGAQGKNYLDLVEGVLDSSYGDDKERMLTVFEKMFEIILPDKINPGILEKHRYTLDKLIQRLPKTQNVSFIKKIIGSGFEANLDSVSCIIDEIDTENFSYLKKILFDLMRLDLKNNTRHTSMLGHLNSISKDYERFDMILDSIEKLEDREALMDHIVSHINSRLLWSSQELLKLLTHEKIRHCDVFCEKVIAACEAKIVKYVDMPTLSFYATRPDLKTIRAGEKLPFGIKLLCEYASLGKKMGESFSVDALPEQFKSLLSEFQSQPLQDYGEDLPEVIRGAHASETSSKESFSEQDALELDNTELCDILSKRRMTAQDFERMNVLITNGANLNLPNDAGETVLSIIANSILNIRPRFRPGLLNALNENDFNTLFKKEDQSFNLDLAIEVLCDDDTLCSRIIKAGFDVSCFNELDWNNETDIKIKLLPGLLRDASNDEAGAMISDFVNYYIKLSNRSRKEFLEDYKADVDCILSTPPHIQAIIFDQIYKMNEPDKENTISKMSELLPKLVKPVIFSASSEKQSPQKNETSQEPTPKSPFTKVK